MQFFCPICQKSQDLPAETTLTTKLNQTAYKAHCPVCKQDLALYGSQAVAEPATQPVSVEVQSAQLAVDEALKEFSTTVS